MAKRSRIVIVDGEVKPLPISKKARTPVPKSRWRNGMSNSQRRFIEERISATAQKERPLSKINPNKVGVVLALDDILITKNRYGWSHVTLIDDERGVEFNIRTKQADQWMKGYREFYSTTTAKHYLHKWEANTVAGREHAVDNHLRGLIKAYSAHGNEYKMNEIYELLRNGSYTEKKQYWENFWQNELPEIPEDFFVYPDLGVM